MSTSTSSVSPESVNAQGLGQKVQDGRIEKSKAKKESNSSKYRIDGRTFACEKCKKGHRVSKCTHAFVRPVSMTNDPGRPSGDNKRRCDCPKQCACTTKNCKCDKNCSCTQKMYMLVYVPMKDSETGETESGGQWKIGHEVITDLQGKELTDDEVRAREELKQLRLSARSDTLAPDILAPPLPKDAPGSPPKSCCQHKKNIEEQNQPVPAPRDPATDHKRPQCNCGTGCACAFCLDHPNNQTSHLLAQQQAAYFSNQTHGEQKMNPSWASQLVGDSCMGTSPRFAISNTPNPSHSQFQTLFPPASLAGHGGYFISYPFTSHSPFFQSAFVQPVHTPMAAVPMSALLPALTPYLPETSTPAISKESSTSSCCHASKDAEIPVQSEEPSADPFDFSNYDIGNAVASGWNNSDFAFDQGFNWNTTNMDLLAGPSYIPDTASVEPSLFPLAQSNSFLHAFPIAPDIPPDLLAPTFGDFSYQTFPQHDALHSALPAFHHGSGTNGGSPSYKMSTPMHGVYAHSPS